MRPAARAAAAVSRRTALGAGVGAAAAAGALAAAPRLGALRALAAGVTEKDILGDLVILEDIAAYFYSQVGNLVGGPAASSPSGAGAGAGGAAGSSSSSSSSSAGASGPAAAVADFGSEHATLRDALRQALVQGGGSAPKIGGTYPDAVASATSRSAAIAAAVALERTTAGAQYAAIGRLSSRGQRALVASGFGVVAQRLVVLEALGGSAGLSAPLFAGDPAGAAKLVPLTPGS